MAYWLVKSEPGCWSWQMQLEKKVTHWDGVRNYQAANNLKTMKIGDLSFFYHSVKEKSIVGIVKIVKEYYPDPSDELGRFVMVDVEAVETLPTPVSLDQIKADPRLTELPLIRQSRLSVMPIPQDAWHILCHMGGVDV